MEKIKQEKASKQAKVKPQYSMVSNVCYMLGKSWKYCKRVLLIMLLLAGIGVAMNVLQLFVVPVILEGIESKVPLKDLILRILLFMVGLSVLGIADTYIRHNEQPGKITIRMKLSSEAIEKVCTTSYINTEKQKFTKLMYGACDATRNNTAATEAIWEALTELLKNLLGFILYLFLMINIHPLLILATVITALLGFWISCKADDWSYRRKKQEEENQHRLYYIGGLAKDRTLAKDVRIYDMSSWHTDLWKKEHEVLRKYQSKRFWVYFGKDFSEVVFHFLRGGIAYAYLIYQVLQGAFTVSEFLLYFSAVSGFTTWIIGILTWLTKIHQHSIDISILRELIDYEEPYTFEEGKSLPIRKDTDYEITLKDVSFRYPESEKDILSHVNLTLHPGEKLAVVGLNGAGKTTLIKLLCGLYDPTQGQVLLNGEDIRQYNRRDYYRHFSAVFQDFSLLAGSVTLNIVQAEEMDMEKVRDCAERAGMLSKIESLPNGFAAYLNKEVYEDAVELSGGELQRLMLARALYKAGPIIILDEPTAAMDPLAEQDMYQRYHELTRSCSSVYISHRLASTRFCDRVILLGEGGILEEGTHEALLKAGGEYARLYQIQSQYYQEEKAGAVQEELCRGAVADVKKEGGKTEEVLKGETAYEYA